MMWSPWRIILSYLAVLEMDRHLRIAVDERLPAGTDSGVPLRRA
jgi:hypothetical protein